jgi:hypothetical protein
MSTEFTPGAATEIAHKCTIVTLGNNHPLEPSQTLGDYGVSDSPQISLIKTRIRTDNDIGLPHFGRSIDANALKDLDTTWTIMKLSDVIFDNAVVAAADLAFATAEAVTQPSTLPETPSSNALVEFTRENPVAAMVTSAAAGMIVGLVLGRILR